MHTLKKALTKDDPKNYQTHQYSKNTSKIVSKSTHNPNNWTDINNFIECRATYQKTIQLAIYQKLKSLTKKSFHQEQLIVSPDILVKSLLSIFQQYYPEQQLDHSRTKFNHKQQKVINLLQFLQKLLSEQQKLYQSKKNQQSQTFIRQLQLFIQLTKSYLDKQVTNRKQKQLSEYDKIINVLKPTRKKVQKKQEKRQNIQKLHNKLLHSLSSGNLNIKITTQQISIQKNNQNPTNSKISHKKSQDNLFKLNHDKKITSPKNDTHLKLQNFFKDPNLKIVKTTVQYDYNAILQGSKSNLQYRNKTFDERNNNLAEESCSKISKNNFEVTNINKAKKDQAFVFYRPKPGKKQRN